MIKFKLIYSSMISLLKIVFYSSNLDFENLALGNETDTYYALFLKYKK